MKFEIEAADFNLEATLESGQVFGFTKHAVKLYRGAIDGFPLTLWQSSNTLFVDVDSGRSDWAGRLSNYFDLERDLSPVYQILSERESLGEIVEEFRGLCLIRQDSWEALACFIISSNNNVKRIQGIWRNLSARLGETGTTFPKPLEIARVHERTLRELGLGYRAPYLLRTAQFVSANPVSLELIRRANYEEAKTRLLQFPGIGEKVADCVLLYGFQRYEAFPVDVWILRVMRQLYFKGRSVSEEKIRRFGQKRWGLQAGYVQQYLFHGARRGFFSREALCLTK